LLATLGDLTAGGSPAALPVTDHAAFCSGCGAKLHESAQFCHACGRPVAGTVGMAQEGRRSP
jgi:predicted amidophosphoribosyltransferase